MNKNDNHSILENFRYIAISIFFICVTMASIVFHNANILYWYIIAVIMELIHKIPNTDSLYRPPEDNYRLLKERDHGRDYNPKYLEQNK